MVIRFKHHFKWYLLKQYFDKMITIGRIRGLDLVNQWEANGTPCAQNCCIKSSSRRKPPSASSNRNQSQIWIESKPARTQEGSAGDLGFHCGCWGTEGAQRRDSGRRMTASRTTMALDKCGCCLHMWLLPFPIRPPPSWQTTSIVLLNFIPNMAWI